MWMMVMFDLPVVEEKDRKRATKFRQGLLDLGFEMSQFSVYTRFCGDRQKTDPYVKKIKSIVPPNGQVTILFFTDKQFSDIINITNRENKKLKEKPDQLCLF
jgi:CRISPR-associated protein Cas2